MSYPIVGVTVLEDRASIVRRGALALPAGQTRIEIDRVSPILADKTVFATIELPHSPAGSGTAGAKILDARIERRVIAWVDRDGGIAKLEEQRAELAAEVRAIGARIEAARMESAGIVELAEASIRELAVAASRGVSSPSANTQLAELDALDREARARLVDAEAEYKRAKRSLDRLDHRIALAKAQSGDEVAKLVVDVIADAAVDAEISIGYVVPGAAWRPYHRATLSRATGAIEWETTACIWQSTGEDWTDVAITCSLERASLGVEPPTLIDDELRTRKKPDTVTVEARDQEHQTTGLGASPSGPPEVPGIDDGGLGLTLSASRATVGANGMPHRISVATFTTAAELSLVAIPLRSPWVHLRATLANTGTIPLLAGPVDLIMDSGIVGKAEIGFVAPAEKFHVGFGPGSDVRVHRSETRERDEAGLLGGWNITTVRVAVRLSNLGAEKREVVVTERVPISEVEQVEILLANPEMYKLPATDEQVTARTVDDKRGMISWTVVVPPNGRRAVALEYKVRSQRGVAGI